MNLFDLLSSLATPAHASQGAPQTSQELYRAMMNGKSDAQRVQEYNQAQAQPTVIPQVAVYGGGGNPAK